MTHECPSDLGRCGFLRTPTHQAKGHPVAALLPQALRGFRGPLSWSSGLVALSEGGDLVRAMPGPSRGASGDDGWCECAHGAQLGAGFGGLLDADDVASDRGLVEDPLGRGALHAPGPGVDRDLGGGFGAPGDLLRRRSWESQTGHDRGGACAATGRPRPVAGHLGPACPWLGSGSGGGRTRRVVCGLNARTPRRPGRTRPPHDRDRSGSRGGGLGDLLGCAVCQRRAGGQLSPRR